MFKFSGLGRTYWESSYFGGVKRILTEYPLYALNYDLYAFLGKETKASRELSIYQIDKLMNILFSNGFTNMEYKRMLAAHLKEQIIKTINDKELLKSRITAVYGRKKLAVPIEKNILGRFIQFAKDSELKTLFDEYGDSITDSSSRIFIYCDPPPEQNDENPDPKGGSSSDKGGSKEPKKSESSDSSGKSKASAKSTESKTTKLSATQQRDYAQKIAETFVNSFRDKKNVESFAVTVKNMPVGTKINFNSEEIVFAKKLNQMLDITHEPKPDIVKNLLQGKMDTDKISEVLCGNNRVYMNRVENQSLKPFKVVVLGDYSGSMDYSYAGEGNKFEFQKKTMKSLFHLFHDVMGIEDIEFYGHSGDEAPILYRFHSPEHPHFMETINGYVQKAENYDGPIIEHIHKMIRSKSSSPVLLISLSDGQPSGNGYGGDKAIRKMKQIMEKVKRDNFVTVGIGMLYTYTKDLYQYTVTLSNLSDASPVARIINRAVKENLVVED